jgi:hypothetical protein
MLEVEPADALLVPIPRNERPLRGAAGLADWRLCGLLSRALLAGQVTGATQELVLVPGRPPLLGPHIVLVGVGPIEQLPGRGVRDAFRTFLSRLGGLGTRRAILASPEGIDLVQDAEPAVVGCIEGLVSSGGPPELELVCPVSERAAEALARQITGMAADARRRDVALSADLRLAEVPARGAATALHARSL